MDPLRGIDARTRQLATEPLARLVPRPNAQASAVAAMFASQLDASLRMAAAQPSESGGDADDSDQGLGAGMGGLDAMGALGSLGALASPASLGSLLGMSGGLGALASMPGIGGLAALGGLAGTGAPGGLQAKLLTTLLQAVGGAGQLNAPSAPFATPGLTASAGAAIVETPPANGSVAANAATVATVARKHGVPADLAVAMMLVESGGNRRAVGDGGTSFGLFQLHEGGMLTAAGLTREQAFDPATNANVSLRSLAAELRKGGDRTPGQVAAASQRPADPVGYAQKVNDALPRARGLLQQAGVTS